MSGGGFRRFEAEWRWVESCWRRVEVSGCWWSWVEVGGGRCRWVEVSGSWVEVGGGEWS